MRTHAMRVAIVLGVALVTSACGGDDDGASTCEELAAIIGDCGGELTEEDFIANICNNIILSGDCLEEAGGADCAEHESESPGYAETCFPSCSGSDMVCEGDDAIRVCEQGQETVYRCEAVCARMQFVYTGVCADEFEDTPSMNGQDVCWCEPP